MARIQSEDFDISTEVRLLMAEHREAGGVVTFLGAVRDFSRGRRIEKLSFERYEGMAEKELHRVETETVARHGVAACHIIHRIGELLVGENILLIIVASPHRKEAFVACQWAIDELKKTVPIWKKEQSADGATWVEERP